MHLSTSFNSVGLFKTLQLDWETLSGVGLESVQHCFTYLGPHRLVGADFSRAFSVGPWLFPDRCVTSVVPTDEFQTLKPSVRPSQHPREAGGV